MLLRYARSQFLDPNAGSDDWEGEVADNKNFYGDDSDQVKVLLLYEFRVIFQFKTSFLNLYDFVDDLFRRLFSG